MWYKEAQLSNFLAQLGYSPKCIEYISSLPKFVQKAIGGELNKGIQIPENQLLEQAQKFLQNPPVQEKQVQARPQFLDSRFSSPQEKIEFFKNIPKEYVPWVTLILNDRSFSFIPAEDSARLIEALNSFTKLKARTDLHIERDINQYVNLLQLENVITEYSGTGSKSSGYLQYNPLSLPGVELVKTLKDGTKMYKISVPGSLAKLGIGTKWCTRNDYYSCQAESYISNYGYIYLFTKDGKPYKQMTPDLKQIMDVNDEETTLPRELYSDFADKLSKIVNVPINIIKQFASEEKANDPEFCLSIIKDYGSHGHGKIIKLVSDELKDNPQFILGASKINSDCYMFASDRLREDEQFEIAVQRAVGNYEYKFDYEEMDDDLQETIYGTENYGVENTLENWGFESAYDEVKRTLEKNSRGHYNDGGYMTHRVAPILAQAAVDSDVDRMKMGEFDIRKLKSKALFLCLSSYKHPRLKYDKTRPEYIDHYIGPYMEEAKNYVENLRIDTWNSSMKENIKIKAFELMQNAKEFDSSKIHKFEDIDPENQRRFLSEAVDKVSQISQAYDKRQKNEENLWDYYDDSNIGLPEEPEEGNFENPNDFKEAYKRWEIETEDIRAETEDNYRKENLPFCLDDSIIKSIELNIASRDFEIPSWIYKTFGKKLGHRPTLLWAIESVKRKMAEQVAKEKKIRPKKRTRASGWFSLLGPKY